MRMISIISITAFSALTLLVGRQEGHPACKKLEWWGAGVVICLERGADLRTAQPMPLPLTVSCFGKIQIGFTFLVSAHPGSPGQRVVKRVCTVIKTKHYYNVTQSIIEHLIKQNLNTKCRTGKSVKLEISSG